jgi:hypothetical protein
MACHEPPSITVGLAPEAVVQVARRAGRLRSKPATLTFALIAAAAAICTGTLQVELTAN